MFREWRIINLRRKIESQQALVDLLNKVQKEYGNSYYTDKYIEEFCKLVEMRSKLGWLESKQSEG